MSLAIDILGRTARKDRMKKRANTERSPNQIAGDNFHLAIWIIQTLSGLASTLLATADNKAEAAGRLHIIAYGVLGFVAFAIGLMMFINSLLCRAIGKTEYNAIERALGAWTISDEKKSDPNRAN